MLDVLIQMVRGVENHNDTEGTNPSNIYVKLSAFNQSISSRIEKNVTKISEIIYNYHLMIEAKNVKEKDLENKLLLRVMTDRGDLISEFSIELLKIY